jgi:ABC-2 type transport system ATP-binding protein
MIVLRAQNITKQFTKYTALKSVSIELQQGEILGLLGPNGAGKTTLIQILLGLLTADSGTVEIFGLDAQKFKQQILERVNFSSTYTNLPWRLTVKEALTYTSYFYKLPNRRIILQEIIEAFRLQKIANKSIEDLSSGQLTRVNLAKAFINNPEILFLDEPTASLDPSAAKYIREFIVNKRKETNVSVIYTSHNMAEIEEICDRVIFLEKGKIIAVDTPENLAKTIDIAHVNLKLSPQNSELLAKYCQNKGLSLEKQEKQVTITLSEKNIASLLQDIVKHGISYDEISIQNPSLEDYFLQKSNFKQT